MIFLSASIPNYDRDKKYFETADIIAIRDAVRALAAVVIPHSKLIWGGHPAITPLIRYVMNKMNSQVHDHVTLYQSEFFIKEFPADNQAFENINLVKKGEDRNSSLLKMRNEMIMGNEFKVGIFIGGMEGVEIEFEMFRHAHPQALLLPIASTGAAARIIYNNKIENPDKRLVKDYAYMSLFKSLLKDIIANE